MAIATGISPRELDAIADDDPELLYEMAIAVRDRWTPELELLAGLYEMNHAQYRVLLSLAGAKKSDIPKPAKIPRPGDDSGQTKKKVASSPLEFVSWIDQRKAG